MKKILSIILALSLVLGLALTVSAAGPTTVTVSIADYADQKSWANGTKYTTINLDSAITVTTTSTQNTGKYYTNGEQWRLYCTENPTITVAATGTTIISVKFTYTTYQGGVMTHNGSNIDSGDVIAVNAASATFGLADTNASDGNGQARVTAITVVYGDASAACEHEYVNEYAAACKLCGDPREVTLPAANTVITYAQAQKLYDAGVTNTIYRVTGVIDEVYNTTYGNMYLKDEDGNKFTVYGLYTDNGSTRYDDMTVKPIAGDTVVVSGKLSAYNSVVQISSAWLVEHTPAEREACTEHVYTNEYDATCNNAGCTNGNREVTLPAADSKLTYDVAEKIALVQGSGTTVGKYYLTGEITKIDNTTYGNMTIKDASGKTFYIYGLYSADGKTRFDAMEKKPAVGDTVTVYGVLSQYNGTAQVKNGWMTEHVAAGGNAQTGDPSIIALAAMMLPVSGIGLGALCIKRKKEN